jgi:beta-galactosidase
MKKVKSEQLTRRKFIFGGTAAAVGRAPGFKGWSSAVFSAPQLSVPTRQITSLRTDWLFLGKSVPGGLQKDFADGSFARVTLPHSVTPLSWQKWDPASWQDVFVYRRHFSVPSDYHGARLFLHFDRVLASATPVVNGHALEPHQGGFLPFEREVTGLVSAQENVLAVEVDSRWLNIPPSGSLKGPASVDYLLPGGITGSVELRAVPQVFLRNVFAKPVDVLTAQPRVEIRCQVDTAQQLPVQIRLLAILRNGGQDMATVSKDFLVEKNIQDFNLTLSALRNVQLWDVDNPHLFELEIMLIVGDRPVHSYATRIGFREARFEFDGFFLNGRRLRLFGLNRHELYPYLGFAAPDRLQRRDAEILCNKFNCNAVRCSHYPQSEAFLEACDDLGLLVWEEPPGWQYIGDDSWKDLAIRDVEAMIRRDRNHPSIVIWGVRINESPNDQELYRRTSALAKSLDDLRPVSGAMNSHSKKEWAEDVFAYDDYHAESKDVVGILGPVEGFPYMIAETVGQFNYNTGRNFDRRYRRAGDVAEQTDQALWHAMAHSKAAGHARCAGVIAWCAFDYASLMNDYNGVKCPGVADVFRFPKLGASFYLAQVEPSVRPVIEPNFYWDFGPHTPSGPGEHAAIFSNCERLELSMDGKPYASLRPDYAGFPNLRFPPFFADLKLDGAAPKELRIDGYLGDKHVMSRLFSSEPMSDRLWLQADDTELIADGSDITRLAFAVVDKFGAPRAYAEGKVTLQTEGPGILVGDNPFDLSPSGGIGAVYIRTMEGKTGQLRATATHEQLPAASVDLHVRI